MTIWKYFIDSDLKGLPHLLSGTKGNCHKSFAEDGCLQWYFMIKPCLGVQVISPVEPKAHWNPFECIGMLLIIMAHRCNHRKSVDHASVTFERIPAFTDDMRTISFSSKALCPIECLSKASWLMEGECSRCCNCSARGDWWVDGEKWDYDWYLVTPGCSSKIRTRHKNGTNFTRIISNF